MVNRSALLFGIGVLISNVGISTAFAQTSASQTTTEEVGRLYPADEMFGIKPAIGLNAYNDSSGGRSTRASYGLQSEFNLASPIGMDFTRWFLGPQTGFQFSHLGTADANFLGSSPESNNGEAGANMFIIPTDLKLAYAPFQWMRIGAHGGGNVVYRSIPSAIRVDNTDLNWRWIPNVGADLDLSISRSVALSIRPDWTLGSGQSMFSTTAALGIALG